MKDVLQVDENHYEVLDIPQSATAAEIEKAFRNGLRTRPKQIKKLTAARTTLLRPYDRAMVDLLLYTKNVAGLTLSPMSEPEVLQPANRLSTARSWERDLKKSFPNYAIAHSLAVFYYWWSIYEENEISGLIGGANGSLKGITFKDLKAQLVQEGFRKQGIQCEAVRRQRDTFASPCSRRAECPHGHCCDKPFPDPEVLWQKTICYWAMVLASDEFWNDTMKVNAGIRDEIRETFPKKLKSMFHTYAQRFHSNGTSALADTYEDLELTVSTEIRTATIMPKAGVRTSNGKLCCGSVLLKQLGLIEHVRSQVAERLKKYPSDEIIRELHISLSPCFSIYVQIENKQYQAALEALEALSADERKSQEVRSLYVTAICEVGKQKNSVGKYAEALECWQKGIEADPKSDGADKMTSEIVAMCRKRATAVQDSHRPEAIALLDKALKIVSDKGLTELLAELLASEAIVIHNTTLEKEEAGEPITEQLVQQYRRALELVERAVKLGSQHAADNLNTIRETASLRIAMMSLPGPSREFIRKALSARQKGKLDEAINMLDVALSLAKDGNRDVLAKELASALCSRGISRICQALDSRQGAIDKLNAAFHELEIKSRLSPPGLGLRILSSTTNCVRCNGSIYGRYFTFNLQGGGSATVCESCGTYLNGLVDASNTLDSKATGLARDGFADIAEASDLNPSSEDVREQLKKAREILQRYSVSIFDPKVRRGEKLALLIIGGVLTGLGVLIGLATLGHAIGWTIFLAIVGVPMLIGGRFYRLGYRKRAVGIPPEFRPQFKQGGHSGAPRPKPSTPPAKPTSSPAPSKPAAGPSAGTSRPKPSTPPVAGKVPCKRCGVMIMPATANKTGGLCMPCSQGTQNRAICPKCGKSPYVRFVLQGKAVYKCTACGHKNY